MPLTLTPRPARLAAGLKFAGLAAGMSMGLAATGCAQAPKSAGAHPVTHYETPDLTILEPKIPANITVEGGVPLVTAVGSEGRHVIGVVAEPLPPPQYSEEEMKILGIDPDHKSYYEKLLALQGTPRTPRDGVNPWGIGMEVRTFGRAGDFQAMGHAPPVTRIGPQYSVSNPNLRAFSASFIGRPSIDRTRVGPDLGLAQTGENEAKRPAAHRDRMRP